MRKHNEGYVLPLVLVVMVILSLIAVGVMSVSLRNLQTQKADIERMQAQYAAQGEIEQVLACIHKELLAIDLSDSSITVDGAREKVTVAIKKVVKDIQGIDNIAVNWNTTEEKNSTCTLVLQAAADAVLLECTVSFTDVVTKEEAAIRVNALDPTYISFDISAIEETVPDASEAEVTGNG